MSVRSAFRSLEWRLATSRWQVRKRLRRIKHSLPHRPLAFDTPRYLFLDKAQVLTVEQFCVSYSDDTLLTILQDAKKDLRRQHDAGPVPVIMPDVLMWELRENLSELADAYLTLTEDLEGNPIKDADGKRARIVRALQGMEDRPLEYAVYRAITANP